MAKVPGNILPAVNATTSAYGTDDNKTKISAGMAGLAIFLGVIGTLIFCRRKCRPSDRASSRGRRSNRSSLSEANCSDAFSALETASYKASRKDLFEWNTPLFWGSFQEELKTALKDRIVDYNRLELGTSIGKGKSEKENCSSFLPKLLDI